MKKLFIIFTLLLILSSCKPTEKGYKAAYDAALSKREAVKTDLDVNLPEGALQSVDGPQLKEVDGKKVYILNQRIMPADTPHKRPENYNVAVSMYKMSTNCVSQVQALREEGFDAFAAKDTEGNFYTIIGSLPDLSEAVTLYEKYKNEKNRVFVGLPESPVIIYSPK